MDNYKLSSLNAFTGDSIDRVASLRIDDKWIAQRLQDPGTRFTLLWRAKNLVTDEKTPRAVFLSPQEVKNFIPLTDSVILLGEEDDKAYFAIDLPADAPSIMSDLDKVGQFRDLRAVGLQLDSREGSLLAYARAMAYWHYRHRFCGDCGSPTRVTHGGHQRVCTNDACKQQHFPRTDPAIIVIITCGKHCLLGRQRVWPKDLYSTIAGFVEPGESLEAAVVREIKEETGVQVDEVYYHSSQAWPFPGSIMIGFTAKTASKDVSLDINELEHARWLSRKEMENELRKGKLKLPTPVSIAFRLIEDWFNAESKNRLRSLISTS